MTQEVTQRWRSDDAGELTLRLGERFRPLCEWLVLMVSARMSKVFIHSSYEQAMAIIAVGVLMQHAHPNQHPPC